jgi:hypothetical protein
MNVITVRRTVFHGVLKEASVKRMVVNGNSKKTSTTRRSFRELARAYFARKNSLEFALEAAVLCDNRGDLSLANPCRGRRATRVLPARARLSAL